MDLQDRAVELHRAAQAEENPAHPSQYFKLTQQAWKADWKRAWILDGACPSNRKGDSSSHRYATKERTLGEYEYEFLNLEELRTGEGVAASRANGTLADDSAPLGAGLPEDAGLVEDMDVEEDADGEGNAGPEGVKGVPPSTSIAGSMRGLFRRLQNRMVNNQVLEKHRTAVKEANKTIDEVFENLDNGTRDRELLMGHKTALELLNEKMETFNGDFQKGVGAGKILTQQGVRIISQNQQLSAEIAALRDSLRDQNEENRRLYDRNEQRAAEKLDEIAETVRYIREHMR